MAPWAMGLAAWGAAGARLGSVVADSPPVVVVDPDPCYGKPDVQVCGWGNVVYNSLCWMELTADEEVRPEEWDWEDLKDDPGVCTAEEGAVTGEECKCWEACPKDFRPVCTEDEGKVYANECLAKAAGQWVCKMAPVQTLVAVQAGDKCECLDCEDLPRYPVCVDGEVYRNKFCALEELDGLEDSKVCDARKEAEDGVACTCEGHNEPAPAQTPRPTPRPTPPPTPRGTWSPTPYPITPPPSELECPSVWKPACVKGKVYGNLCKAYHALGLEHEEGDERIGCALPLDVSVRECDESMCVDGDGEGEGQCPEEWRPTCVRGTIYGNLCKAYHALDLEHEEGGRKLGCPLPLNVTRGKECDASMCVPPKNGTETGGACPEVWRPTCVDGKVYGNECKAHHVLGIENDEGKRIGCPLPLNISSRECNESMCIPPRNATGNETQATRAPTPSVGGFSLGGSVVVSMNVSDFQTTYAPAFVRGLATWYGVDSSAVEVTCICEGDCATAASGVTLDGRACSPSGAHASSSSRLRRSWRVSRALAESTALGVEFEVHVVSKDVLIELAELSAGAEAAMDLGDFLEAAGMPSSSVATLQVSVDVSWASDDSDAYVVGNATLIMDDSRASPAPAPIGTDAGDSTSTSSGSAIEEVEGLAADSLMLSASAACPSVPLGLLIAHAGAAAAAAL